MQFQPHASSDALKMAEIATGHAFCDREYAPGTAHKRRFRQAKKPCKHNFVQNLGSVA